LLGVDYRPTDNRPVAYRCISKHNTVECIANNAVCLGSLITYLHLNQYAGPRVSLFMCKTVAVRFTTVTAAVS